MRKLLRIIKRIADKTIGSNADALFWRFRHVFDRRWGESYISGDSLGHPHRTLLIDRISAYAPFRSLLEVGCASGPNLYLLAKRFPAARFYGTDISAYAIRRGEEWLKEQGVPQITLSQADIGDLARFPEKSIDIVISDAVLIYAGPGRIEAVVKEFVRVARKAIVLVEWHTPGPQSEYRDHWVHNYRLLFEKFAPPASISVTKIPPEIWAGNWARYGYVIEVRL